MSVIEAPSDAGRRARESGVTQARCPTCRGRLAQEPICPRCGCDLTLVRRAEAQARQFLVRAVHAYARGDATQARALARAALKLERSRLATGLLHCVGTSDPGLPLS